MQRKAKKLLFHLTLLDIFVFSNTKKWIQNLGTLMDLGLPAIQNSYSTLLCCNQTISPILRNTICY